MLIIHTEEQMPQPAIKARNVHYVHKASEDVASRLIAMFDGTSVQGTSINVNANPSFNLSSMLISMII